MSVSTELFDILLLRSTPEYHAAEVLRRQVGAAAMATSGIATTEYAALRLLIGTWETIALRVRANEALKVPFYEANPVGHMWDNLQPGIGLVRKSFKGRAAGALYAANFQRLNRAYRTWLQTQPAGYQSAALQGINAMFG